ncbi:MAG: DUF2281 domain-containing protein [Spirulinaceae cyanobacterium SM2_1_0]|nr:DUF2281 domain-containing protein [Spirulinaceae cyanobacterium SM2_1_0]
MTTLRDELDAALDQIPETDLAKVLVLVRSLQPAPQPTAPIWQAYQDSKQERQAVDRHLADA